MTGVGIGIDAIVMVPVAGGAVIRVADTGVSPAALPLIAGQSGADLPAAWFDPGNYAAPGVVSVELRINAAPADLATAFQPGDSVELRVRDDQATPPLAFLIDSSVAYPAPTLTGALVDQAFVLGTAGATYDASVGFAGTALSYALVEAPAGVEIDAATGLVDMSGSGLVTAAPVVIRAETPDAQGVEDSFLLDVTQPAITATLSPAMSPLFEGQAVQDVTDFAAMTAPSNYTSTGGAIQAVSVSVQGAVSEGVALTEGALVGFSVEVTDTAGYVQSFVADPVTVDYAARVLISVANEADIDINPAVPDAVTISLTFTGTEYDGTYTPMAGDIRNGVHNFAGTAEIEFAGLEVGDVLTADPGLWSSPTDQTIAYAYEWRRGGVAIAGETGATYTLVSADVGQAITLAVTGDDGVEAPVTRVTGAVNIPGGAGEAPTYLGSAFADGADTIPFDLSAAASGDAYYLIVHAVTQGSEANRITGVEVGGVPMTMGAVSGTNSRAQAGVLRYTANGAETGSTPVRIITDSAANAVFVSVHKANGWAAPDYQAISGKGLTSISAPHDADGPVIAAAVDSGRSDPPQPSAPLVSLGVTASAADGNVQMHVASDGAATGAYTPTFTQTLGTQMALASVALK